MAGLLNAEKARVHVQGSVGLKTGLVIALSCFEDMKVDCFQLLYIPLSGNSLYRYAVKHGNKEDYQQERSNSNMLIRVTAVEVCDARDDDSSNAVDKQIKYRTKSLKEKRRKRVESRCFSPSILFSNF